MNLSKQGSSQFVKITKIRNIDGIYQFLFQQNRAVFPLNPKKIPK